MKYFIAIEDELLLKLWMHNPQLVAPLSRPIFPLRLKRCTQPLNGKSEFQLIRSEESGAVAALGE